MLKSTQTKQLIHQVPLSASSGEGKVPPLILGIDEAGRGALAGPVVVCGVIFTQQCDHSLFQDSKQLSEEKRALLFQVLKASGANISIASLSHRLIDRYNIFQATMRGMGEVVQRATSKYDQVLIDGNRVPGDQWLPKSFIQKSGHPSFEIQAIVKGDQKIPEISAASIAAKVTRDEIMNALDTLYPQYGFRIHKGYATKLHYDNLFKYGPSPVHRQSFNLTKQESLF